MIQMRSLNFAFVGLFICACCCALPGCGGKTEPAKTQFTEQDKQQIEELNKQRVDEWGRKIK